MMLLRDFLLRIHLCNGIGIVGKSKIYDWIQSQKSTRFDVPSVDSLIKIANIRGGNVTRFSSTYIQLMNNSERVDQLVDSEKWLCICDEHYPYQLKEAYTPPLVMFYRGDLNLLNEQILGIVGARDATHYSMEILKQLLPGPLLNKLVIVSGLAKGVDTWAHQCTIANHGRTIAVIGTGLNIAYPSMNQQLQQQIAEEQLLLSEYPNGSRGYKNHFPERNRIIAGLVESVLVTEAKHHSGSLITANLALQNNRNVLAVPGRINHYLSAGTNKLIAAGTKPILRSNDVLEEYIS